VRADQKLTAFIELERERDKPRQGVAANTLKLYRNGAVGFIDWLGTDYSEIIPIVFNHFSNSSGHSVIGNLVRRIPNAWPPS
jgi:hypothetical protein